jgi:hypothetical protein
MAPQVYNYKEIEEMAPTDELELQIYTMTDLKRIIYDVYRELGNYNIVRSDCRVFARRVIEVLKKQQPIPIQQRELFLATKSTIESYTDSEALLGNFKPTEKLLVAKIFEVVELLWGQVARKISEFCVFSCLRGHVENPSFVENFLVLLSKDTQEDTMLFLRMVTGWFQKKSYLQTSLAWNVHNNNPKVFIKSITSSLAVDGNLEIDLAIKGTSEYKKEEAYPALPYKK